MNRSIIISSVLHAILISITALSLPFLAKKPLDIPPIVSVELIQIAEKTNIPFAPKAKKIIEKVNDSTTIFSTYSRLKPQVKKRYPQKFLTPPTKSDYRIGTFKRYFTQKANDLNSELFEISKRDFEVNNLARYIAVCLGLTKYLDLLADNISFLLILKNWQTIV